MKKKSPCIQELEKEGSNWYIDRYESVQVERNRYFVLLLLCLAALLLSILASLMLFPLKTAVPYVIQINKATGESAVLQSLDKRKVSEDQAVTIYFLHQYLNARMNYNYDLLQMNVDRVRGLSTDEVYKQYARSLDSNNPQSPINQYHNTVKIKTNIVSHSFPYPNIAQIRFYTELTPIDSNSGLNNATPIKRYYSATIQYRYADIQIPVGDRENINPLGFFVTNFQIDEETQRRHTEND